MNRTHDGFTTLARQFGQRLHHALGLERIQPARRFVGENHARRANQLHPKRQPLLLSSADPARFPVSHARIRARHQPKIVQQPLRRRSHVARASQPRRRLQRLPTRQHRVKRILLLHVRLFKPTPTVRAPSVRLERASQRRPRAPRRLSRERVQQRRLPRPARSHDRQQSPRPGLAVARLEHAPRARRFLVANRQRDVAPAQIDRAVARARVVVIASVRPIVALSRPRASRDAEDDESGELDRRRARPQRDARDEVEHRARVGECRKHPGVARPLRVESPPVEYTRTTRILYARIRLST